MRIRGICLDTVLSLCSEEVISFGVDSRGSGPLIVSAFSRTIHRRPSTRPLIRSSQNFRCADTRFCAELGGRRVGRDVSEITRYVSGKPVRKF